MAERSTLNQVVQIGVETTSGTSVAANKRLTALSIEPSPSVEVDQFRPAGQKYQSFTALSKEWTQANLSGRLTYTEIIYLLSSIIDTTTPTTVGTNGKKWTFVSDPVADDAPKTFTVEHGSATRADKFTYGMVNELTMSFNRQTAELSGSMMGKAMTDNITMTATPTVVALKPVLPTQVSVYLDTTSAGLGTTKLDRVLSVEWSLGSRFNPIYPLDSSLSNTFAAVIESEPDLSVSMTLEADDEGMARLTDLRAGTRSYLRIEAVGAALPAPDAANNYKLTVDTAVEIVNTGGFNDNDGLYTIDWQMVGVVDSA
jgi:hypothetical protein